MDIRLTPYSEDLLKQQLAQGGFDTPEQVVEQALETLPEKSRRQSTMNLAEFDASLDLLAEGSERLPVLPNDATTRAGIYREQN